MSDSQNVMTRFVAVLFFLFAGAAIFGFMTHSKLEAAEKRVTTLEQNRSTLEDKLNNAVRIANTNQAEAKTCSAQIEEFKTRAQTAESALEGAKGKKTPARPSAG
jgi:predicted  nucleic acid-binding Zn-ribbon protein